jgi:hypothetical protein
MKHGPSHPHFSTQKKYTDGLAKKKIPYSPIRFNKKFVE